jgi:peptidoglycan/LPS O-acetylase OafA/YrhL
VLLVGDAALHRFEQQWGLGMRRTTALVAAVVLTGAAATGCGSKGGSASRCIAVRSTAVTSALAFSALLGLSAAAAAHDETFSNGKKLYYVANSSGAVWAVDSNPSRDESALVLPLNAAARSESQTGANVPAGAPIFGSASADSKGAKRAIECVKSAR